MTMSLTPKEIVNQLDHYIVGQKNAKRSVAVALRNRYRRMNLDEELRDEIVPKNILMIGPTGVGKTEVARRIAKLAGAPFVKVEATKFTEVGYVGRDVESMVRDLVEFAVRMVKDEKMKSVMDKAEKAANERIVELIVPKEKKQAAAKNPFDMFFGQQSDSEEEKSSSEENSQEVESNRKRVAHQLALGELENKMIQVEIEEQTPSMFDMFQGSGMEQMGTNMQDALSQMMPKKKKKRKMAVSEARKVIIQQEAQKLIDMDDVVQEAIQRTEQSGIIFIDEIDKVANKGEQTANVSREGVQRDILPIVEGSTVMTKHGTVKTDHVLFIAAGAFHMSKPSDLIPELQGRFPIRVEFDKLSVEDFKNILTEPSNALLKQYQSLLKTEGIDVIFKKEAVDKLAQVAYDVNQETDNIGARRLHTILEKLLEDLSFEASEITMERIEITEKYVEEKLGTIAKNKDLSQFIL